MSGRSTAAPDGPLLMALAPLDPLVWTRRRRARLPFPLDEPECRLFAMGRHALWHGVRALGLEAGDEVLVPAYHHGSEVEALRQAGLRCRFYDIDAALAPDADQLAALLGERTRALHLIHYLGFPQDAHRWRRWCDAHGLLLIEDAAQAWLSRVDGHPAGAFGDVAIYCLYKTYGLPDGGALLCRGAPVQPQGRGDRAAIRLGMEHGAWIASRSAPLGQLLSGLRPGRPYDRQADHALGRPRPASLATCRALPRVADPATAEARRSRYGFLLERLGDAVHPAFAALPPGASPFVFPVSDDDKAGLLGALRARGIRALDLWAAPHPALRAERFPQAAALRRTLVGLPVHQELRRRDLDRIVVAVQTARAG
jgi:DegT/DnrJ/EryC1/StrS aminotransferase family